MKKAIVFAGGGSKGAYEIGAWKALNELGEYFDIATGTSIGSINAGFYVQHDFDAAYEMWNTICVDDIMEGGFNFDKSLSSLKAQKGKVVGFAKDYVSGKGADVTPFHNSLKKFFDADKFAKSEIDFACMTVKFPKMEPCEITKDKIVERGENGWEWLGASAAAFPVFPVMKIDGEGYVDGGYYDNIPVASAFKLGAQRVTVIGLKPEVMHEGYAHHPFVTYIRPTKDLGAFLNFDRAVLERSIKLGYNDTMKKYGRYFGDHFTYTPGDMTREQIGDAAVRYLELLTLNEANYKYYETVHLHRVNTVSGCSALLCDKSYEDRYDAVSLFFSALEIYMELLGFDAEEDYCLPQLLDTLAQSVKNGNTAEDFRGDGSFRVIEDYIRSEYDESKSTIKKLEDDNRVKLIASAMAEFLAG